MILLAIGGIIEAQEIQATAITEFQSKKSIFPVCINLLNLSVFLKIWETFGVFLFVFPAMYFLLTDLWVRIPGNIYMSISLCLADVIALIGQLTVLGRNKYL